MERSKRLDTAAQPTCSLCYGEHRQCSTPSSWKLSEARSFVHRLDVSADKPVCSACRRDVTRMLGDSRYIPRWERSSKPMQCTIEQCSDRVFTSLHKIGSTNLSAALETARLTSSKKTARCLYT